MNRLLIILLLSVITIESSKAQINYLLPCDSLELNDSTQISVTGLMDHNDLDVNWIREKIENDSIEKWLRNYTEKMFEPDERDDPFSLKIINEQIEYDIARWNNLKQYMRADDIVAYYTTPKSYWESLAGQDGLIIIRRCKVIGLLILAQS